VARAPGYPDAPRVDRRGGWTGGRVPGHEGWWEDDRGHRPRGSRTPLLVDDLLALELDDGQVLGQPGYPVLRLWPEQADHFLGGHADLPIVHPEFTKRWVQVGQGFGSHQTVAAPLHRIYLPARRDDGEVVIAPVRSRDALIATVRNSFLHDAVHGFGLAGRRLGQLAAALETVRVRRITYPSGFERLPELVAAIEADVAGD
jgi:hypothetical protein